MANGFTPGQLTALGVSADRAKAIASRSKRRFARDIKAHGEAYAIERAEDKLEDIARREARKAQNRARKSGLGRLAGTIIGVGLSTLLPGTAPLWAKGLTVAAGGLAGTGAAGGFKDYGIKIEDSFVPGGDFFPSDREALRIRKEVLNEAFEDMTRAQRRKIGKNVISDFLLGRKIGELGLEQAGESGYTYNELREFGKMSAEELAAKGITSLPSAFSYNYRDYAKDLFYEASGTKIPDVRKEEFLSYSSIGKTSIDYPEYIKDFEDLIGFEDTFIPEVLEEATVVPELLEEATAVPELLEEIDSSALITELLPETTLDKSYLEDIAVSGTKEIDKDIQALSKAFEGDISGQLFQDIVTGYKNVPESFKEQFPEHFSAENYVDSFLTNPFPSEEVLGIQWDRKKMQDVGFEAMLEDYYSSQEIFGFYHTNPYATVGQVADISGEVDILDEVSNVVNDDAWLDEILPADFKTSDTDLESIGRTPSPSFSGSQLDSLDQAIQANQSVVDSLETQLKNNAIMEQELLTFSRQSFENPLTELEGVLKGLGIKPQSFLDMRADSLEQGFGSTILENLYKGDEEARIWRDMNIDVSGGWRASSSRKPNINVANNMMPMRYVGTE